VVKGGVADSERTLRRNKDWWTVGELAKGRVKRRSKKEEEGKEDVELLVVSIPHEKKNHPVLKR